MKKLIFALIIIFAAIQFIPYNVPADIPDKEGEALEIDDSNVAKILERSCYDCHSNHTKFPWYSSVAPISYFTKHHVKEARAKMNFSKWNSYSDEQKKKFLEKIPKAIEAGKMPLPSYLLMHKEAKLSEADKKAISNWASEAGFDLE